MRGQIPQLFIFIAALLVIGATAFIGMRLIAGVENTACDAADAGFKSDLDAMIVENAVFGSRNAIELRTSCDATQLCFADAGDIGNEHFTAPDATIEESVRSGVQSNIFLLDNDGVLMAFYDERIILRAPQAEPAGAPLCIKASQGRFSFRTEGFGRSLQVKP